MSSIYRISKTDLNGTASFGGGGGGGGGGDGARNTGANGTRGSRRQTGEGDRAGNFENNYSVDGRAVLGGAIAGSRGGIAGAALGAIGGGIATLDSEPNPHHR